MRDSANLDVMVLEVSSFQLENIVDFRPRISVHLNLTPDHLDRYETMEEYDDGEVPDLPQPDGRTISPS